MLVPGRAFLPPGALALLATILCCCSVAGRAQERASGCAPVARVVSVQGTLHLQRAGQGAVSSVRRIGAYLCENDLLHADAGSRAALFISAETLVRLDQNSTVRISHTASETVVEFIKDTAPITRALLAPDQCGAGYFITRYPRRFRVITPFANAVVEGTEFLVALRCESTDIAVFEGKVRAELPMGAAQPIALSNGQSLSVGEGQPPAIRLLVKPTDAVQWVLYYPPLSEADRDGGPDQLCDSASSTQKSRCLTARAERRLRAGRVQEARADIEEALKLSHDNADVQALSSVISVAQNEKVPALDSAQRATQLDPLNPRAWIALSYAQQASFKLEEALASAEHAAALSPRSALAQARVAELLMSLGKIRSAERAARAAVEANPNDSRAHTVLGFVHLAQINTKEARAEFQAAIERDSTDPLPRLGLGLAIIRDGDLKAGREEIEIAVALDPTNSLIRSYVGKAYYEENTKERDQLATSQFGLAKALDPKDPTPWFYDAILKQSHNQLVEALERLQRSIELNDNRAVYRSRLLLDEDVAARSAGLARIYSDLGFIDLGQIEAAKSLAVDPRDYSAHYFLADIYAVSPRHEIARESELLQAQLRQPFALVPISPARSQQQFSSSIPNAGVLRMIGPSQAGLNEFNPLFDRNALHLYVDGLIGDRHTLGDQLVVSGLQDNLSMSLGQAHFESNEFRENRDIRLDAYNAFFQANVTPRTNLQAEIRSSDTVRGSFFAPFDEFPEPVRLHEELTSFRLGLRQGITPDSDLLVSGIYQERDLTVLEMTSREESIRKSHSFSTEAQYSLMKRPFGLVAGFSHFEGRIKLIQAVSGPESSYDSVYAYTQLQSPGGSLRVTLGLSVEHIEELSLNRTETSPKLGLMWIPQPGTLLRAAAFHTMKRQLIDNQTIEPTQVAGFNQLFDDLNGTLAWRYGVGVDQQFSSHLYGGLEATQRDITSPAFFGSNVETFYWVERNARAYLYYLLPHEKVPQFLPSWAFAFSAEASHEYFRRPEEDTGREGIVRLDTTFIPLTVTAFPREYLGIRLGATYVQQRGRLQVDVGTNPIPADSDFWLADLAITYRIPARRGAITAGISNLFNRQLIRFQDTDPENPTFSRGRFAYARVTLQF